jgi:hypothetical protein
MKILTKLLLICLFSILSCKEMKSKSKNPVDIIPDVPSMASVTNDGFLLQHQAVYELLI